MDIRQPNDVEIETIRELSPQSIFDGTLGAVMPTKEKIDNLITPLLERGSYYLIAAEDTTLMGWVLVGTNKDQFTESINGFIYELYVIEAYRGKGISKRLMTAAINQVREEGYDEVGLNVFSGNDDAIQLYEKMGFNVKTFSMSLPLK
ncbi:GNAT family N-acetyltransferase [Bacillus sp. Marseille-P3800]|uniref:GNAT family N-acetyltransferase n=1 Tax=Bacillus sp. Marseille-P3800 TaxID=2014782 RepID=UPI000C078FEC|nr:GNAT family N-acetyltransferase [Bacillus sp. Marseille-P3800]